MKRFWHTFAWLSASVAIFNLGFAGYLVFVAFRSGAWFLLPVVPGVLALWAARRYGKLP